MIKTVTVLGANGTMGSNVSGIFASFGGVKVYLVSRTIEKSKKAMANIASSVKADSVKKNLIPADYSMLEDCIRESDLIFESVAEDLDTKIKINNEISSWVDEDTIICTGSSGLSIKVLAEVFPENIRKNYLGVHFFNPPYNLTLCEIIPSEYTEKKLLNNMKDYVGSKLHRTVVQVTDSPAFLGNRIGFQFINETLQYAEKYKHKGGIDYIDSILGPFTGRSMPPLVTSNFVGLDVHQAIVDNLYDNTNDYAKESFIMPNFAVYLVNKGILGKKTNGGLYKTIVSNDGTKKYLVYDISLNEYREVKNYNLSFTNKMVDSLRVGDYNSAFNTLINDSSLEAKLCLEFLLKYVVYSLITSKYVGDSIHAADDVMAAGFGWCPPLGMVQALFGIENFVTLAEERLPEAIWNEVEIEQLFSDISSSKYDYRRFFQAKH
ncbi:3-hydroxyacyl-CoA dehydrogenase family protein [Oceanobacillus rekensis]|uniref:3-hydroxyacyl-CoA dehydrogenase family protein n=1 Tax=Oceanobacillus rekensis TaxID=937927 RepID=UPI000B440F22|nr:3-hydroxyacyl-CoA dehydrogenase family protein [Oceanobacillus rekensis]